MANIPDIAQPPLDAVMPAAQLPFTEVFGVLALASLIYVIFTAARTRSFLPVVIFVGGVLSMFCEPIATFIGHNWYPAIGQITLFETLGRKMPLFVGFAYCFYFAPGIIYLVKAFEKGMTVQAFWLFQAASAVFVILYDYVGLYFGLWLYYGNTPLTVDGFPLWWIPTNLMPFVPISVIIYLVKPYLQGWRVFLLLPLMSAQVIMFHALAGLPTYTALNSDVSSSVKIGAMGLTAAIYLVTMWACSEVVCKPSLVSASRRASLTTATN